MSDEDGSTSNRACALDDIDRWKRAMDGIVSTFVETGVTPAEGVFILAKCIGHTLQEIPDSSVREQLLGNLTQIIRRVMQPGNENAQETFIWN